MVGTLYTLRKREVILSAIKSRVRKTTHKFGIEIPTSIEEAERIDRDNENNFWREAVSLKIHNGVAFEVLGEGTKAPPGWNKASGHIIFGVKMDLSRKAR